jgi:hypothetical protein
LPSWILALVTSAIGILPIFVVFMTWRSFQGRLAAPHLAWGFWLLFVAEIGALALFAGLLIRVLRPRSAPSNEEL